MFQAALLRGRTLQALQTDEQLTIGRCQHYLALRLVQQCELQGDDLGLRPKPRLGDVESAAGEMHIELNLNGPTPSLAITAGQIILSVAIDALDAGVFEQDRGPAIERKAVEANAIVAIHGGTEGAFLPLSHRRCAHDQNRNQSTSSGPRQGATSRFRDGHALATSPSSENGLHHYGRQLRSMRPQGSNVCLLVDFGSGTRGLLLAGV